MSSTTVKIDEKRREKLKDAAFEVSMALKEVVPMSEIIKYLVDNYTEEAVKQIKEKQSIAS